MTGRQTYLATKIHREAGLLLKVGCSENPRLRCASLSARPFCDPLPHHCEGDLHRLLKPWRVWTRNTEGYGMLGPEGTFEAPGEWFYMTETLLVFLEAYVPLARSAEGFTPAATLEAFQRGYNPPRQPLAQRTLRAIRLDSDLSIRQLEEIAGVNRAIISQLERGTLVPSGDVVERLGGALGVELEWKPMVVEAAA